MKRRMRNSMLGGACLAAATAVGAACPCAYIPSGGANSLAVLDLTSSAVTATIPLGASPLGAAVDAAAARVYVTEPLANALAVVNAANNTLVTTIPGFDAPYSVVVHPDGSRAFVSETGLTGTGAGTVRVVTLATNRVAGTLAAGDTPHGVALTPDGGRLFVANSRSGTVTVIDTGNYTLVSTLTGMITPEGVAVNLAGTALYVADGGANLVRVYALPALTPVTTIPVATGPGEIAVRPAGDKVHATAGVFPGRLVIINTSTNTVAATLTVGDGPAGVAFSPDGSRSWVPNNSTSNSVSVIAAATDSVATTVTGFSAPSGRGPFIVRPPWAASLSPTQAPVGGGGFPLTVNGTGFFAGSVVRWNGAARATTFVNDRQVTAAIPASDLAAAGSATVTVDNPAPAGGLAPFPLSFSICAGPPGPGNSLRLTKASPEVHLAWAAVTGATSYNVKACAGPFSGACAFATLATPTATGYDDPVLASTTSYRYAIEAANSCTATP